MNANGTVTRAELLDCDDETHEKKKNTPTVADTTSLTRTNMLFVLVYLVAMYFRLLGRERVLTTNSTSSEMQLSLDESKNDRRHVTRPMQNCPECPMTINAALLIPATH